VLATDPALGGTVGFPATGAVTVASNGILAPSGTGVGGLPMNVAGNLVLNSSAQVSYDFGITNSLRDTISIGGNLTLPTGANFVTINLNGLGGAIQTMPLFTFAGSLTNSFSAAEFQIGSFTNMPGVKSDYSFVLNGNEIDLFNPNLVNPASPMWATTSGTWDTTLPNWINGSPTANLYKDGDNASFGSIASNSAITITSSGVTPASVAISNSANTYTFSGGPIMGFGPLTKTGSGGVVLASSNSYSGGTVVSGGTMVVDGGDNRLGVSSGPVYLDGGSVFRTATVGLTSTRTFTIGSGGATFDTNGLNSTSTGSITLNGPMVKTGSGMLSIGPSSTASTGWAFNGTTASLELAQGTVSMNGVANFGNYGALNIHSGATVLATMPISRVSIPSWTQRNGGIYDGNLVMVNPIRMNFDGGTFSGSGEIQVQSAAPWTGAWAGGATQSPLITDSNNLDTTGGIINVPIHLNSLGNAPNHMSVTTPIINNGVNKLGYTGTSAYFTAIAGTNNGTTANGSLVTIGGGIYGDSDVVLGNNDGRSAGGSGHLRLASTSSYTGVTQIDGQAAFIHWGVNNALPVTTDVVCGTLKTPGANTNPILDLNGFNQEIASLSQGGWYVGQQFTIYNNGPSGSISTLKISGSTVPYFEYPFLLSDGPLAQQLKLVRSGSGMTTLTGANGYSGGTTVNGGVLWIDNSITATQCATGYGDVNVTGGTFGGLYNVGNPQQGGVTLSVSANATLAMGFPGTPVVSGSQSLTKSAGTLTVNGNLNLTASSTLLDLDALTSGTRDVINVLGTLTLPASGSITLNLADSGSFRGTQKLIGYVSESGTFRPNTFVIGSASSDAIYSVADTGTEIDLIINSKLTWTGSSSNVWNTNAAQNFHALGVAGAAKFQTNDAVTFDDSVSGGTVTISGSVSPNSLTFSNSTQKYTLTGGTISGSTGLVLTSGGTVELNEVGAYTGGTTVNSGTLIVDSPSAIASGTNLSVGSVTSLALLTQAPTVPEGIVGASVAAVPEPSTFALLGAGIAFIAFRAVRRRK
jgi:autotransporter-associated beta strand protein